MRPLISGSNRLTFNNCERQHAAASGHSDRRVSDLAGRRPPWNRRPAQFPIRLRRRVAGSGTALVRKGFHKVRRVFSPLTRHGERDRPSDEKGPTSSAAPRRRLAGTGPPEATKRVPRNIEFEALARKQAEGPAPGLTLTGGTLPRRRDGNPGTRPISYRSSQAPRMLEGHGSSSFDRIAPRDPLNRAATPGRWPTVPGLVWDSASLAHRAAAANRFADRAPERDRRW